MANDNDTNAANASGAANITTPSPVQNTPGTGNNAASGSGTGTVSLIGTTFEKVKLPDFVEENTDLWFWQVETQKQQQLVFLLPTERPSKHLVAKQLN